MEDLKVVAVISMEEPVTEEITMELKEDTLTELWNLYRNDSDDKGTFDSYVNVLLDEILEQKSYK